MEEYSIGELAKRFNVSVDTLRLYDKKGIICPKRKKNGYRYYSRNDMIALGYVIFLKKTDLSLEQIRVMLNETNIENSYKALIEQENYLEKKIQQLQNMKKLVEEYSRSFQYALKNHGEVVEINDRTIILNYEKNDRLQTPPNFSLLNDQYKFAFTFIGDKEMFICNKIENSRMVISNVHYGISAVIEGDIEYDVKEFFQVIKPRRYVYSVIKCYIPDDYSEFDKLLDYINANNLEIIDDIIVRSVSLRNGPLKNIDYYEVFIPVQ